MPDNKIKFMPQGIEWVWAKITKREAIIIQKMRQHAFGQITVFKKAGVPVRIEANRSELIEEDTELTIEHDNFLVK